jgi:hypothetical protein
MKPIMRTATVAILAIAAVVNVNQASAQTELAGWNVNGITTGAGGAPPAPFAATTVAANVIAGNLTKGTNPGPGLVATGTAEYGGNTWTNANSPDTEANSIACGFYVAYNVQAATGYTISFGTNFLNYHNSATGPTNGALQYCTDGVSYSNIAMISYAKYDTATTGTNIINLATNSFLQNVPSGTTNFFRIVNWGVLGATGTWYIYNSAPANAGLQVIGSLTSSGVAPFNLAVTPASLTTNAGAVAEFTVSAQGDPPSYAWYSGTPGSSTPIANATNATLVMTSVLAGNAGSYYVVLSNATGVATSSVVSLTVTGDPGILFPPNSTYGLLDGTAQFAVTAAGTSPSYYWYVSNANGTLSQINNGGQSSGSTVSGAFSSTLSIANLKPGDQKNYVVVVSNAYGSVTSPPAALISVSASTATLAFWNFNGPTFVNTGLNPYPNNGVGTSLLTPPPYYGVGTASAVGSCFDPGTSPFSGSVDPMDNPPYTLPSGATNYSWGTDNYPASGGNKSSGVQFMVSTVGAKNIAVVYDSRVSATASDYERLQYTTNGTDWIDYPTSSTFNGLGTTYQNYSYSLAGFPGVANNPDFGIRVVTEYASTATYNVGVGGQITNGYVGTANTYGTAGTVTYDLVYINGQAITNAYSPPTISAITNNANMMAMTEEGGETNVDYIPVTNSFTIGSATTPVNQLVVSAQSLNPNSIYPSFSWTRSGSNVTMVIAPYSIQDTFDAAPILVTVTDTNGDSTAAWFTLTLQSLNLPPTNTLTTLGSTTMLANSTLALPFGVGSDHTPASGLSYSWASYNNTVLPYANMNVTNQGMTNPVVVLTAATNQMGIAPVSVTVNDNYALEQKYTTANFAVMVRPNTNIVAMDYFNYDQTGALDSISAGYWKHLSGVFGQMQAGGGSVVVDTIDYTENLQTKLLGAPYTTNSGSVLYASYIINMSGAEMPLNLGSYFTVFNDGSGSTGFYECGLYATTNGAAAGCYRVGVANMPAVDGDPAVVFPMDLLPGSNYFVVTSLALSNAFSTLWVDPQNASAPSVSDYTVPSNIGTNALNISDFELRESGSVAGSVSISNIKIGTTLDSVFPCLNVQNSGGNVVVTWSDPTLGIQCAPDLMSPWVDVTNATSPYTNTAPNSQMYYKFGQ